MPEPATPLQATEWAPSMAPTRVRGSSSTEAEGGSPPPSRAGGEQPTSFSRAPATARGGATEAGRSAAAGSACSVSESSRSLFESINRVASAAGAEFVTRRSGGRRRRRSEEQQRGPSALAGRQALGKAGPARLSLPALRRHNSGSARKPLPHAAPGCAASGGTAAQQLAAAGGGDTALAERTRSAVEEWMLSSAAAAVGTRLPHGPDQQGAAGALNRGAAPARSRLQEPAAHGALPDAAAKQQQEQPQHQLQQPGHEQPRQEAQPGTRRPAAPMPQLTGGVASGKVAGGDASPFAPVSLASGSHVGIGAPGQKAGKEGCSRFNPLAALSRLLRF